MYFYFRSLPRKEKKNKTLKPATSYVNKMNHLQMTQIFSLLIKIFQIRARRQNSFAKKDTGK